jgi:hypothetical protein
METVFREDGPCRLDDISDEKKDGYEDGKWFHPADHTDVAALVPSASLGDCQKRPNKQLEAASSFGVCYRTAMSDIRLVCLDFDGAITVYDAPPGVFHPAAIEMLNGLA